MGVSRHKRVIRVVERENFGGGGKLTGGVFIVRENRRLNWSAESSRG